MKEDVDIIRARLKKPVVMIGLMGAGKTKIGGLLATALAVPFVDADQEIEKVQGRTIAQIFEQDGEATFRALERAKIAELLSDDLKVVAPGGGAMMDAATESLVHNRSICIWLRADLDILVERTSRNANRPLLKNGNPHDILGALIEKRYPVYAGAHIAVETTAEEPEVMLERVLKALAAYLASGDNHAL